MSGGVAKAFQSFSPTGSNGSSKRSSEPRSGSRAWALQWDVETCSAWRMAKEKGNPFHPQ